MRLNRRGFTQPLRARAGFTLIELIIVIVIIGVLASIVAPMMRDVKVKAICSEAVTTMGALRTALRAYKVGFGSYPSLSTYVADLNADDFRKYFPGIENADRLTGTYFGKQCYYVMTRLGVREISAYMDAYGDEARTA